MRIALISDSHTKGNIDSIYEYLKEKKDWKLDLIIINGDILGEDEAREGYGYNYNKKLFKASFDKAEILKGLAPNHEQLRRITTSYEQAEQDDALKIKLSQHVKNYVSHRYEHLFEVLKKFSGIAKTCFNIGTYESPLHYKVLAELAFLLNVPETYIRGIALLSDYRDTFKNFLAKIKDPKLKRLEYIGGNTILFRETIIAGIPGLNQSSGPIDNTSEFQERITKELLDTVRRQLAHANKLILLNQTQGKLRKTPFAFRPASRAVREFIEEIKGKLRIKVFVQSYHHFMTTHFYEAVEFHFILNNSAVNNSLFNLLEIGKRMDCYDVDPKKQIVRKLTSYDYNLADYDTAEERLALNYEDAAEVIKQRNLEGCYYL